MSTTSQNWCQEKSMIKKKQGTNTYISKETEVSKM